MGCKLMSANMLSDAQFAPEHHFTMITHSRMSHTALPAHIDDDRLVGSGPIIPAPMTEYNTMSYFLNRIEWTLPLLRLVEQMNELGTLRYSLIEEAHNQFMRRADDEPAYFNIENPQYDACATDAMMLFNLRRERIALYLYGHLRILRVHRLYLAQSLRSEKYELSTRASLRAATFIIEHNWKATHGLPTRYWPLQYAALTATSALFHLYCHAKGYEEENMLANLVSSGIKILKSAPGSSAVHASADALRRLLDESSKEPPTNAALKRKRGDEEDESRLSRLIKRVIRPSGLYPGLTPPANDKSEPTISSFSTGILPTSGSYSGRLSNMPTHNSVPDARLPPSMEGMVPGVEMNEDWWSFWNYALPEWQLNPEDLGLSGFAMDSNLFHNP
ncbi:hypothetical protein QFC22_002830 [Naganishia vaughanmartiniae]|uniref:Uncharacterized protein n=1 Tax=Naganishia vaughanmartiniae TaxID=1424756 RepID=A0ACC2XA47_9TREE|nr:hypothetical protein QFC22_002830 [Naganishia vaughanmartiniae]